MDKLVIVNFSVAQGSQHRLPFDIDNEKNIVASAVFCKHKQAVALVIGDSIESGIALFRRN